MWCNGNAAEAGWTYILLRNMINGFFNKMQVKQNKTIWENWSSSFRMILESNSQFFGGFKLYFVLVTLFFSTNRLFVPSYSFVNPACLGLWMPQSDNELGHYFYCTLNYQLVLLLSGYKMKFAYTPTKYFFSREVWKHQSSYFSLCMPATRITSTGMSYPSVSDRQLG